MVIMKVDYLYQNTYSLNISDHILISSRPGSYLIKDAMTVSRGSTDNTQHGDAPENVSSWCTAPLSAV